MSYSVFGTLLGHSNLDLSAYAKKTDLHHVNEELDKKVNKSGDTMFGNLIIGSVGADAAMQTIGCTDLVANKTFALNLGDNKNPI